MPAPGPTVPIISGIIEGESLRAGATATEGTIETQDMGAWEGDWSNLSQLWWHPTRSGARLTLTVPAPAAGTYELIGHFTRANDYGDVRVFVNGTPLAVTFKGYNADVVPSGPVSLGRVPMKAGPNQVVLEVTGKDTRSSGYLVGLDGFVLRP
jgi:hypothetical protein